MCRVVALMFECDLYIPWEAFDDMDRARLQRESGQ
jgi:hypothetical protein